MRIFKDYFVRGIAVFFAILFCINVESKQLQAPAGRQLPVQPVVKKPDVTKKQVEMIQERSLARVQKAEERQAGIDTRSLQAIQDSTGSNLFTQTEAYFQVPKLRKLVTEDLTGYFKVIGYMDIVS